MARKERRYSNRLVLVMLIAVLILSVLSLSLYLGGDESKGPLGNDEDTAPKLQAQGTASLVLEKRDPANEKELQ